VVPSDIAVDRLRPRFRGAHAAVTAQMVLAEHPTGLSPIGRPARKGRVPALDRRPDQEVCHGFCEGLGQTFGLGSPGPGTGTVLKVPGGGR